MEHVIPLMFGQEPSDRRPRPYLHPDWWNLRAPHPHEKEGRRILVVLLAAHEYELGQARWRPVDPHDDRWFSDPDHPDPEPKPCDWKLTLEEFVDWARKKPSVMKELPPGMLDAVAERQRLSHESGSLTSPTSGPATPTNGTRPFTPPEELTKMRKYPASFVAYVALRVAGIDPELEPTELMRLLEKLVGEAPPNVAYITGGKGRWVEKYDALAKAVGSDPTHWGEALVWLRRTAGLDTDPTPTEDS